MLANRIRYLALALALSATALTTSLPSAQAAPADAKIPGLATNIRASYGWAPLNIGAAGSAAHFRIYNTTTTPAQQVKVTTDVTFRNTSTNNYQGQDVREVDLGTIPPGGEKWVSVVCEPPGGTYCSSFVVMARLDSQQIEDLGDNNATVMGHQ